MELHCYEVLTFYINKGNINFKETMRSLGGTLQFLNNTKKYIGIYLKTQWRKQSIIFKNYILRSKKTGTEE